MKITLLLILALCPTLALAALDTAKIETATGLKGTLNETEGVFKVSAPRTDVKVSVDGWQMPPFMGLTSWAAFTEGKKAPAMVMGLRALEPFPRVFFSLLVFLISMINPSMRR